jgi:hypothetical protein
MTMGITLPVLTPMQEGLFLTLCGRALDSRSPHPILADTMTEEIVRKLGYDYGKFRLSASPIINITLRAKKIDEVAPGSTQHSLVPKRNHGPALPLLAPLRRKPPAKIPWTCPDRTCRQVTGAARRRIDASRPEERCMAREKRR